ncbi:WD40 repeat domain-containing protein [Belnapia rosea]|nr:hypothetical protein [Belnapia rosea]
MRLGFAPAPGIAAAPPSMYRAFFDRPTDRVPCIEAARRLVANGGKGVGSRELTGPLVAAFGSDATITMIDPSLRLGPAGLAGIVRLPGPPKAFTLDTVGQRLFVATAEPPVVATVDLVTRRADAVLSFDKPVTDLAWDAAGEVLLVLSADGVVTLHDPDTLQPRAEPTLPMGSAGSIAILPRERLVALASIAGQLLILDAPTLRPLHVVDLPGSAGHPVRLAVAEETATIFVAAGALAFAIEATSGRLVARLVLPASAKAVLPLPSGRAAALLIDGAVVVLDAAAGLAFKLPAALSAEVSLAGPTLYLRPEGTSRLTLVDALRLRPGRVGTAVADAGAAAFGNAGLPLLAPLGEAMLVGNPEERRIYLHHGMGMASPRAAFAAGGSPLAGIVALAREPARTAAARIELTTEAPGVGRWRLIFALPEQGRAVCHEISIAPEAPA